MTDDKTFSAYRVVRLSVHVNVPEALSVRRWMEFESSLIQSLTEAAQAAVAELRDNYPELDLSVDKEWAI